MMRQKHQAGEKLFIDYAGQTVPVVDPETGEVQSAQIFVAVLGVSNYTYAEAHATLSLPNWIGAHVRALTFLGGAPAVLVPDNLKAGVKSPHRYEPDINPTYQEFARHYGLAKRYGNERLEAACRRALTAGIASYKGAHNILKNKMDQLDRDDPPATSLPTHANIRGETYYN